MSETPGVYHVSRVDREAQEIIAKTGQKPKLIGHQSPIRNRRPCPPTNTQSTNTQWVVGAKSQNLIIREESLRGGFAQVPNIILRDPKLSANAKVLYALLLSYAWKDGECFPGQARLAADMGCNQRTVTRTLAELRKTKLISWRRVGLGKANIYYIERLTDGYLPAQMVDP